MVAGQPMMAAAEDRVAWAGAAGRLLARVHARGARLDPTDQEPDAVLAADRGAGVLVTDLSGDRDLPFLASVADRLRSGRMITLRHNPARRWVGRLSAGPDEPVIRAYATWDRWRRAVRAAAALSGSALPVPAPVDSSPQLLTLTVAWVAGRDLAMVAGQPMMAAAEDPVAWARAAGRMLARLHASGARLDPTDQEPDAAAVQQVARQLGDLLPELRPALEPLVTDLVRRLDRAGPMLPLHGDFSADQVVLDPAGPRLIDLDSARLGPAAADLGAFAAADPDLADALRDGYAEVRDLPAATDLVLHEAAQVLRRAAEPFRRCDPRWRAQVASRVTRAVDLAGRSA